MARTDALAVEGLEAARSRAGLRGRGADMLFWRRRELSMYRQFADAAQVPILANITEFGARRRCLRPTSCAVHTRRWRSIRRRRFAP